MKKTFYITTPIYYPSDKLHIGHSYTTVAADAMARFKRMDGYEVFFLTGTDEHGQKIEKKARAAGVTPKEYVDNIVDGIKKLWELMDVKYDRFIRTTDEQHVKAVQQIFKELYDKGDIYKDEYEGWYCTPDEAFWTESQLKDGKCPECGREVQKMREESYFFRLSKYQDALIKHMEDNPDFLQPASRQKEMLANFLRPGLDDLCVSRTSVKWGIPVTFDEKHTVYVWIDALSNYITALGYGSGDRSLFDEFWPADLHLVGKEIVRFHAIIWPAVLMALNLPLPKQVFGHGWLVIDGEKMSKSLGNVIDPVFLCERYGVDAIRYYLMREMPFGSDGSFTNEALLSRINSDLANDLGNLVNRTIAMMQKYFGGILPAPEGDDGIGELKDLALSVTAAYREKMEQLQFSVALTEVWKLVSRCNKYIDQTAPWILAKNDADRPVLQTVMYNLAECLRIISILISPVMTATAPKIQAALGLTPELCTLSAAQTYGLSVAGTAVSSIPALFPRIDIAKELEALKALKPAPAPAAPGKPEITYDQFGTMELKVGVIKACERVKGSDKLLKSTVECDRVRTVVSGIGKYYSPDDMIGRRVVVVANLKPAKLMGILSEGMILCAEDENGLSLITPDRDAAPGSEVR